MPFTLYFHPLSSFCMKALTGLYELDVPFTKRVVDLMDPVDRAAFLKVWPAEVVLSSGELHLISGEETLN